ncbi:MAG: P-II family nitrogen regulator [Planctomycetaceae bacterium]|nr:P-II family nitrogen regulator [Planctomycetaceae bacterium]
MKKIEAIIRHHKLDEVRQALLEVGVHGVTVTEVRGLGGSKGHLEIYRGQEYAVDFTPRLKVEVLVTDRQYAPATEAIIKAARTGQVGDGRILVTKLAEVVRVRTGETGEDAI